MSTEVDYMEKAIKEQLINGTIHGVVVDAHRESFGLKVVVPSLDNETEGKTLLVWVDRDAEGNGAGWLDIREEG